MPSTRRNTTFFTPLLLAALFSALLSVEGQTSAAEGSQLPPQPSANPAKAPAKPQAALQNSGKSSKSKSRARKEARKKNKTGRTKARPKVHQSARVKTRSVGADTAVAELSNRFDAMLATSQEGKGKKTLSSSLYDPNTAQASSTRNSIFNFNWFGPKAAGIHYDARMVRAAQIAEARARRHSIRSCWRYVKEALMAAKVVDTYPQTALAKQAGYELTHNHGFRQLPSIRDPFKAPVGSVLVYGGRGAGHVEIRTPGGFVSDFESPTPSRRPLLGVYVKPS